VVQFYSYTVRPIGSTIGYHSNSRASCYCCLWCYL